MIGIYALYWEQSSMVYIGKGSPIENRFRSHRDMLEQGSHYNSKVSKQYSLYGQPEYIVLEECLLQECPLLEELWIQEFNAIKEGLNINPAINDLTYGVWANRSKYSKRTILKVFSMLYNTNLSLVNIAARLKVNQSLPTNIACSSQHIWLKEEYPSKYAKMLDKMSKRNSLSKQGTSNPMSKYSKRQILRVFSMLYSSSSSLINISRKTNTNYSFPKCIVSGSHKWLKNEYPVQYDLMLTRRKRASQ